ncbi:ATP-dependent DNA helicase Srs2p [Monosporozyma servazzii]
MGVLDHSNPWDKTLHTILSSLNEQQLLATKFDPTQALQVIAGPGTGKTKVLTSRVAYMLLKHQISPSDIIVTTFTNKAAKEMVERLNLILKDTDIPLKNLLIGTFHGICLRILNKFGHKIGLTAGWRIVEEREIDNIVNEIIKKVPDQIRDYANSFKRTINLCRPSRNGDVWEINAKMIKKEISKLKSNALLPEEYENEPVHDTALAYFYHKYQEKLNELNTLDFDDLLMYCFRLLTKERCLPHIKHVFVDEFQDTNSIQMDLMFLMAKGNHHISRGITVVGDPDQSIYAFRNALDQNFQEMINKSPLPCSQIVLIQNYRSTQKILDTSEALIQQQQKGRTPRAPLRAQFDCNVPPVYVEFPVLFLQAPSFAKEILYLKALPNLFTWDDFAILVRQRRQIKSIETALIEHRIPYKIVRGRAFWELKEITAMLNLFRCVISDKDKTAILQSLIYPSRGLGQTTLEKIKIIMDETSEKGEDTAFGVLRKILSNEINFKMSAKIRSVISSFVEVIDYCRVNKDVIATENILTDLFDKLYKDSGLEQTYLYEDGGKKQDTSAVATSEPNYENARHKNIGILKKHFLGVKQIEEVNPELSGGTEENNNSGSSIENISVNEYVSNFFNSLSIFNTDSEDLDKKDESSQGQVTISTIHGAKGLEWPAVFVPGCCEGIIPSIFSREEEEANENGEDDEDDSTDSQSSSKNLAKRPKNADVALDEERRMFFVAQTRAKVLLYLSSVKENESNSMAGGPSRFLTSALLATMVDDQKVFADVKNIKLLYNAMKKPLPGRDISDRFSFKVLLKDYRDFIANRREKLVWGGRQVSNVQVINLLKNKQGTSSSLMSDFSTAADQLKMETQFKQPAKQYAPSYPSNRTSTINSTLKSPQRSYAPASSNKRSPSPKKLFAPPISNHESPMKGKAVLFTGQYNTNMIDGAGGRPSIDGKNLSYPLKKEASFEYVKSVKIEDTTASEILHNPEDLIVDNRPIIASAKTLVDAINKKKSKEQAKTVKVKAESPENTQMSTQKKVTKKKAKPKSEPSRNTNDREEVITKSSVKKEVTSSQFDIFSQLSRARRKPKSDDNEIIIID